MYFWNIKSLATDISSNKLSEYEKFKYFIAFMIIIELSLELSYWLTPTESSYEYIQSISTVIINILGVIWCYKVNSQIDNKEFFERFICLSFPITIKLLVWFFIIMVLYFTAGFILGGEEFDKFTDSTSIVDVTSLIAFNLIFYWRLSFWTKHVAQRKVVLES